MYILSVGYIGSAIELRSVTLKTDLFNGAHVMESNDLFTVSTFPRYKSSHTVFLNIHSFCLMRSLEKGHSLYGVLKRSFQDCSDIVRKIPHHTWRVYPIISIAS